MSNLTNPVPREIDEALFDEKSEGNSEGEFEEELDDEFQDCVVEDLPFLHDAGVVEPQPMLPSDSDDELIQTVTQPMQDAVVNVLDSDDMELQATRQRMLDAVSPLPTCSGNDDVAALPRFIIEPQNTCYEVHRGQPSGRARRARRGGRFRGYGRGRRGLGRAVRAGGSVWLRGEPLRERYVTDEELPEELRVEIGQLLVRRENERSVDHAEEGDERDEEVEFFDAQEFAWEGMDTWDGRKEDFLPEHSGPTRSFRTPYEAFRAYWDDDIVSHIVTQTNLYARNIQREQFLRTWYATNIDEIFVLFAFWMMLGIINMPSIKSCFSNLPLLRTEVFRKMFTEKRYWNLNAAFHLAEGSSNANDLIHPIRPIVDHMNLKFQEVYNLSQDICIDESLTLWKGPLAFKQYIKTKAARFGIKAYQLCESSTGYLWSFFIYVGRATTHSALPSSTSTVLQLVRPVLNKGHVLYMDIFFNSPMLARYLKLKNTDCVGTLQPSRKHVPVAVQRCPLTEGEFIARHSGNVMVVALQDRKRITCLSTFHDVSQIQKEARLGRQAQYKLKLIDDYNHGMGGVDRLDQMLEAYLLERKQCAKWTKKLFKRILNITIQNARVLLEKSSNTKVDALAFRLWLVQEIIDSHLHKVPRQHRVNVIIPNPFPEARLTERHFIRRIPVTDEMRATVRHASNLGRRRCVWCNRNPAPGHRGEVKTVYECPNCNVPLCLERCFEEYHTISDF